MYKPAGFIVLLFGAGCASAKSTQPETPSNSGHSTAPILVRLANKGEFPATPESDDEIARKALMGTGCEKSGSLVGAYYRPVAAFARKHLIGKEHGAVHESQVTADRPKPKLRDGLNIVVDPRAFLGELRIVSVGPPFYAPGTQWAETGYCLHVVKRDGSTTIVLEESWTMMR